jgi:hypothetical protein
VFQGHFVVMGHIIATITSDTIVAFFTPLVALLTSWPMMLRKEKLSNFCILQRVQPSSLVLCFHGTKFVLMEIEKYLQF